MSNDGKHVLTVLFYQAGQETPYKRERIMQPGQGLFIPPRANYMMIVLKHEETDE